MDDHKLTDEELERREEERVAKLAAGSRQKMAYSNLLKPDLKSIRKGHAHDSSSSGNMAGSGFPTNPKLNPALQARAPVQPAPAPAASKTDASGVPHWKKVQQEREEAERRRAETEAKAKEEAARQIQERVATAGLTMNYVDEDMPSYHTSPRGREVFDPNAVPDYVTHGEKTYTRTENFDPSATPDVVSKPEINYFEPSERFDPTKVPDVVSHTEINYNDTPTAAMKQYCPWCGEPKTSGNFCSICGKNYTTGALPGAQSASAPSAGTSATSPRNQLPPKANPSTMPPKSNGGLPPKVNPPINLAPGNASSSAPQGVGKTYPAYKVHPLVHIDGGNANELAITSLGCEAHELRLALSDNGHKLTFNRIVKEGGSERKETQTFTLPYQISSGTLSATYNPHENGGMLRIRFSKMAATGTPARGEHEITRYTVPGVPGSTQQRLTISIDQTHEYYRFVPGQPTAFDTTMVVVLSGTTLEFRSSFSVPEANAIRNVSGKQTVNLPKAPFIEQLSVDGRNVLVWHEPRGVGEQRVPDANVHIAPV